MIPQSFKDIVANGDYSASFQTWAMVIFMIIFLALIAFVVTRPKKYYKEEQNAPFEDDQHNNFLKND